jgi:hypothetical protein
MRHDRSDVHSRRVAAEVGRGPLPEAGECTSEGLPVEV